MGVKTLQQPQAKNASTHFASKNMVTRPFVVAAIN
jgi:hypothetical protein